PQDAMERAHELLERLRIGRLAESRLGQLSQGERKKVMLARALMASPRILIRDEPCSGLDLYERERLLADLELFGEEQINLVYVTHHIEEIVPLFTHVLLIEDGKVLASGRKEDVLTSSLIEGAYQVKVEVDWYHGRPWIKVV